MWIQFLDDALVARQAQFREGDQVLSINGVSVKTHDEVWAALNGRDGSEVEIIIRHPRFSMICRRHDYFARTLDVRDVFVVDEKGKRN